MTLPKYVAPKPRALMNFFWPTSWMVSDPERFNALIKEAASLCEGGIHFADNLFTWARNNSLFDDVAFREAWERNVVNDADRAVAWRRYFLATMAYHAVQLPGDFVECGVYAGTGVKTVMDYLGGTAFPKPFWAYDTYDYNPVEGHAFDGQRPGFFEEVTKRFEGYANVRLVKGFIPESFAGACPEAIAYLHIDLNNAQAEIAALDHLFDRVVPGGVVILDDYEWANMYRTQKLAEDPWFDARRYRVTPLPTGQGFVIKR
ncbi:MAG: class I SAM-dependent methyltransferase [Burkholderiales bacterium]|nr:class I SAM-dependent methyltransferase [Burkholderiales bacterium]MCL4689668.1 class I SAM-dependent methyltransferase [Burkholderiales bacterium]